MAADSDWKPAYDYSMTFGTAPSEIEPYFQDCEFRHTVGNFPAGNQKSGGWHEFGVDVDTLESRGTILIDRDDIIIPPIKVLADVTFNDGMQSYTGKGRMIEQGRRGAATGGFLISFTHRYTGPVTVAAVTVLGGAGVDALRGEDAPKKGKGATGAAAHAAKRDDEGEAA